MFKHNVKYVDFNGVDREEDFYFHLSLPEVTRIEARVGERLKDYIETLVKDENMHELLQFLEEIMLTSYGIKSPDGRSFVKNKEAREAFEYSPAYAELFEEMLTEPGLAQKFGEQVADNGKQRRNEIQPTVFSDAAKNEE